MATFRNLSGLDLSQRLHRSLTGNFKAIFLLGHTGDHNKPLIPPVEPLGFSALAEARPLPARIPSDVCLLPKNLGPCEGYQDAWHFDIDSRRCHKFKSGGGNGGNLFQTEEECKETCKEVINLIVSRFLEVSFTDKLLQSSMPQLMVPDKVGVVQFHQHLR